MLESNIEIRLKDIFFEDDDKIIFGKPFFSEIKGIKEAELEDYTPYFGGRFLIYFKETNTIISDPLGQYRAYYYKDEDSTYVLTSQFVANKKFTPNWDEYNYWIDHGYTTGFGTFYKEVKKIPGCSIVNLHEEKESTYINSKVPLFDYHENTKSIISSILETYDYKKLSLLFSGGIDSTYLLICLIELDALGNVYFFKNTKETKILDYIQDKYNIPVKIVNGIDNVETEEIIERQIIDYHSSYTIYSLLNSLEFENEPLLSGQNADSLFSLGPTEKHWISFIKRYLIKKEGSGFLSNLIALLLKFKDGKHFHTLSSKDELAEVVMKMEKYIFLNQKKEYDDYISKLINYNKQLSSYELKYLYKINSFMQGSDSQVMYNAADLRGANIFLSFSNFNMLRYCIDKKTCDRLLNPKKELSNYLKNNDEKLNEMAISNFSNFEIENLSKEKVSKSILDRFMNKSR